jgi:hypothetical protein
MVVRGEFSGIVSAACGMECGVAPKVLASKKVMLMFHVAHSGAVIHHIKTAASKCLAKRSGLLETA